MLSFELPPSAFEAGYLLSGWPACVHYCLHVCPLLFKDLTLSCPYAKQVLSHGAAVPALTVVFWKHVTY